MRRALELCGQPHTVCPHVLVAGTNGKGSTASLLAALATVASKRRTALYTSPHLVDFSERIRIDGRRIDDELLLALGPAVLAAFGGHPTDDLDEDPTHLLGLPPGAECPTLTYFELATLIGTLAVARERCQLAVYEVGLGGRLDATNALDPALCVVTAIGLDHTELLGTTLDEIAAEKAAVARSGRPAIIASRTVTATLEALCRARGAQPVLVLERDFAIEVGADGVRFVSQRGALALPDEVARMPVWRRDSVAAALMAAVELAALGHLELDDAGVAQALERWRWPGRLWQLPRERLAAWSGRDDVTVLLDAAHNPDGARALASSIAALEPRPAAVHLVTNALRDKDAAGSLAALRRVSDFVTVVPISSNRALTPEVYCARTGLDPRQHAAHTLTEGLLGAVQGAPPGGLVVVTGSIYLLGEVIALCGCEDLLDSILEEPAPP